MALKLTNNASSTLTGSLTAIATTLTVDAGDGALFPTLSGGDWFPATLVKLVAGVPVYEIVRVTARSSDVFTITRAQEGTTATTFSGGDRIELRATAGVFDDFIQAGEDVTLGDVTIDVLTTTSLSTGAVTAGDITADDLIADEVRGTRFIDKTVTNAAATGGITLNCSLGDVFDLTTTGNVTSTTLSNVPTLSGETFTLMVRVSQGATAYTFAWFGSITWLTSGGTAPAAPAANKTVEYIFSTKDGTNFIGRKGASN